MSFSPAPSQSPSGLSATILSSSSLSISWIPVPYTDGYVLHYNGGKAVVIEGQYSANWILKGLKKGSYIISVYAYNSIFSAQAAISIEMRFDSK